MLISVALIFFLLLGVASAADVDSVSIKEDSNFDDSVNTLSSQNNLEISNEVSISDTNMVNSQNDNLQASYSEANNTSNVDTLKSSGNDVLESTKKIPVKMSVTSAVSNNTATLFKVSVKDSETNKAVNGAYKVLIFLDGKKYIGTTNNGVAQITTKALNAGTYNINLTFTGSASRYLVTDATQKVTVTSTNKKVPVKMSVTSAVSNGVSTVFKVSVKDSETNKDVNGAYKVLIILDGTKYIGTTNNGVAQITTKALNAGTYNIDMTFTGSASRYLVTDATQKVTVTSTSKKVPVKMSVTSAISNNTATVFKVSVLDSETNKAVNGAYKVLIFLDGTKYVGTTNNGVAQIVTKALSAGTYNIDMTFTGSASRYLVTDATQKVTVTKSSTTPTTKKVSVKMSVASAVSNGISTVFKVSVKDGETNKAVNGAYKVLIILDGKKYVGTTVNGVAQITTKALSAGKHTINLTFAGSASRYLVTDATQKVTVSKVTTKNVWINADGGSDDMKKAIVKLLEQKGWTVYVGETYSNAHYTDYFKVTSDYQYYITLYNGFCAGTVREAYSSSIQNVLKSKGVQLVIMWDSSKWTNPDGMKPYRYGDFTGYDAARAWDDNFSKTDPSINNVGAWLKRNNAFYCVNPTAEGLVTQFLAGGYFAYSGK